MNGAPGILGRVRHLFKCFSRFSLVCKYFISKCKQIKSKDILSYIEFLREYRPGGAGQAGAEALDDGGHGGHGVSGLATKAELRSIQGREWN